MKNKTKNKILFICNIWIFNGFNLISCCYLDILMDKSDYDSKYVQRLWFVQIALVN